MSDGRRIGIGADLHRLWAVTVFGTMIGLVGGAQASPGWPSAAFDRPVGVTKRAGGTGLRAKPDVVCTVFRDLTIVERGTESPNPEAAHLIKGASKAPGDCGVGPAAIPLRTADYGFLGRRGRFLFFEQADPQGAVPFKVLDAETGRVLFEDATLSGAVESLGARNDGLDMRYRRGVNAPCSLLKAGRACWSTILTHSPVGVPDTFPAAQDACKASYPKGGAKAPDPSLVSYAVAVRLERSGEVRSHAFMPVACQPQP